MSDQYYKGDYHQHVHGIPGIAYPWVSHFRANKFIPYVAANDVVVELGVGHGWNVAALPCRKKIGVDIADNVKSIVETHGIDFMPDSARIESSSANIVICHHVLEHLEHPKDMIEEGKRILAPGGRLLLYVPYEKQRKFRKYIPGDIDQHLYSWTPRTFGNLVALTGLSVSSVNIIPYGYERAASVWSARLGFGEMGFRALRWLAWCLKPAYEICLIATKSQ